MGIFTRWFGRADAQSDLKFSPESQRYIFDACKLSENGTKNGAAVSPRDNFETLKLLANFAAQEGLRLTAVFTGRPLREAAEGSNYKNVTVHYAENTPACRKIILQLVNQAGAKAVVVTADAELEQTASAKGADCMRISTFKKALENRESRRSGRQRRNDQAAQGNGAKEQQSDEASRSSAPRPTSTPDAPNTPKKEILDLIDPI